MSSTVYIILFRGVGGPTQLPVKPLREKLSEAGFEEVATYINSGNAVLRSRLGRDEMIRQISSLCRLHFGYEKAIFAPTLDEWLKVIAHNPFVHAAEIAPTTVTVAWLVTPPQPEAISFLNTLSQNGDAIYLRNNVAYLHTPQGFSRSTLAKRFDKKIGVLNTARNWNTVKKLAQLGQATLSAVS